MARNIPLNDWLVKFEELKDRNDVHTACELGFYDWFCKDTSLMNKIRKMAPLVKAVATSPKVNPAKSYVFFKNNCLMSGSLYDSLSICNLETGDVEYWITPKSGHTGNAEVVQAPDFGTPIVKGTVRDIRKFFKAA